MPKNGIRIVSLITAILLVTLTSNAAEVDNFSQRNDTLKDSTSKINEFGNKLFLSILEKTNKEHHGCEEEKLYKNLRKEFRNGYIGEFLEYLKNSEELDRQKIPFKKSIYSLFSPKDAIVTGLLSKRFYDSSASVLNVNGYLIGTDKFEHFSGTGYRYFKSYYLDKKSIEETVAIGFSDEYGILGAWSTGIISYGDLAAEFNGMRFWNHILQLRADLMGENIGPYVQCENGKWIQSKKIDWSFYIDHSWDEAINCSEFRTWTMVAKVKYKLKELSQKTGKNVTCPLLPNAPKILEEKYQQFGQYILNFNGINIRSR